MNRLNKQIFAFLILFSIASLGFAQNTKIVYPNILKEAGYKQKEIDQKLAAVYFDLFEGPNKIYFEVEDSMAYVSDLKNNDARTEGLSYGMMVAVQLDKKEVFDKIWRWSKKYIQHQDGPRKGYFAWSINPKTMKKNPPALAV